MKVIATLIAIAALALVVFIIAGGESTPPAPIEIPVATGHVNDHANIISPETEATLESSLREFKPEIAVLTVESMGGLTIDEYSIKVAEAWKVGDADKDDGVILIVSTGERKVRIEVGYGSEAKINDAKAGRILDESVVPKFKNGDWEGGILDGVLQIKAALTQ